MTEFTAGPRLGSEPQGDPRRQAVDSLRGYAYQLYVSALAWLGLSSGQSLFLEIAEDYAVLASSALKGVQVKDTAASGSLTINNTDVLQALKSFVDLVHRNPELTVSFRFLTTSKIGRERDAAERIAGSGVLEYWRLVAQGADVAPLRKALLNASIDPEVRRFIEERDDEPLREELIRRIHWDGSQPDLAEISAQLEASLVEFASDRLRASPSDCAGLSSIVVSEVLKSVVKHSSSRRLSLSDLLTICEAHTKIAISRSALARLQDAALHTTPTQQNSIVSPSVLESADEIPVPQCMAPRHALVENATRQLGLHQMLFLAGGSGLGKTLTARLTAKKFGGRWLVLDLRNCAASEARLRLELAFGQIATRSLHGVILDDLNQLEAHATCIQFARLLAALKRRDAVCIVTCYKPPSTFVVDRLGLQSLPLLQLQKLSVDEVRELVQLAGGQSEQSTQLAYWYSGNGHPQLARAFIAIAQQTGWDRFKQDPLQMSKQIQEGIEAEQRRLRQSIIEQYDKKTRTLLYRTSLLIGRFDRQLALELAEVTPVIDLPGESLELLIGPWIDEVANGRLRTSPLVERAGEEVLGVAEQAAVHRRAAEVLGLGDTFEVGRANATYVHAIKGRAEDVLWRIGLTVARAGQNRLKIVADWMPSLCDEDCSKPIYTSNENLSRTLRLAQVLLLAETEDFKRRIEAWTSLQREISIAGSSEESMMFEYMALSRALVCRGLAQIFPNPIQLLERHHALTELNPRFKAFVSDVEQRKPLQDERAVIVSSVFFVTQALEVGTVARQRQLFVELGRLNTLARARYLAQPATDPGGSHAMANAAWLAEAKAGTLDWAFAADVFKDLAELAMSWEQRELALNFLVARCIMFDEYGSQPESGLAVLSEAEDRYGNDVLIARARAKIHYRSKRYDSAILIVEDPSFELARCAPLERLFICRETAISAGSLGDWGKCRQWFQRAMAAGSELESVRLQPMLIGLRADHALSAYRAGDHAFAVSEMAAILRALPKKEDPAEISTIYCHRVVHHGLLWMYAQASEGRPGIEVAGQPPYMVPGMCSNPEPPEAIREQPRAHSAVAWHLLAAVESHHVGGAVARSNLDQAIGGRTYPSLELMTRSSLLESAIRRSDEIEFAATLGPWLDSCVHLYSHAEQMKGSTTASPTEGPVALASVDQLGDAQISSHIRDAVLCFAISAAIAGRKEAIEKLPKAIALYLPRETEALLDRMLRVDDVSVGSTKAEFISDAVRRILRNEALTPELLFTVSLRFLQALVGSVVRYGLERQVVSWLQHHWRIATSARFAFKNPDIALPKVLAALDGDGLRSIAAVLLAAEFALNVRVTSDMRSWLRTLP